MTTPDMDLPQELVDELYIAKGELGWIGEARLRVATWLGALFFFIMPDEFIEAFSEGFNEVVDR